MSKEREKPANEMNEIHEQVNEHVDHSKTIREFIKFV
jgi:predicted transcriptional regulator